MNWKSWCRLCASMEINEKIEQEIQKIAEQLFVIPFEQAFICLDCKSYIQDLNSFVIKAQNVTEFFDEIEQVGEIDDESLLQLRLNYNLPVDGIEIIEETDMNEIESEEETAENAMNEEEVEYLMDTEPEPEVTGVVTSDEMLSEEKTPIETIIENQDDSADEEIVHFEEDDMVFQEVAMDSNDLLALKNIDYEEEISNHFEFRCHICQEIFKKMQFLATHTQTSHNCLPRVACRCGRIIGSNKTLIEHYENHVGCPASFQCTECKKKFKTQAGYNQHMMTHNDEINDKKFECECGKSFKEFRHLTVHRNSHLPNELKFVHVCEYCSKRYSSIFSLRQHIKHVHVKETIMKCPQCDKEFSRKANLDSHVSHVHTMERKFECDICGLKVKTKSILRVHKKIHSTNPEDLLTCSLCSKNFKTQNQLTNHMVCHSNVKRFKCDLCPSEYKRSKELVSHIASVHSLESKYTCKFCTKSFNNNSNLRKHTLRLHLKELQENE